MLSRAVGLVIFALALAAPGPAHADAIDGLWCAQDGRRITIEGPKVTTPRGATLDGRYGRHDFVYVVPAGEPNAGETVNMRLRGEFRVFVTFGNGPVEEWNRCRPGIS